MNSLNDPHALDDVLEFGAPRATIRAVARRLSLRDRLRAEPHRFDPLQAMRILELGRARVGTDAHSEDEPFVIDSVQILSFLASPLLAAEPADDGRAGLLIGFLGLTGPLGVLPHFYTETVIRATRLRNRAVGAFLDMLNQRLAGLFMRASEKYRIAPWRQHVLSGHARHDTADLPDPVAGAIRAVAGYGTPGLSARSTLRDDTVLYFAGLFGQRNRSSVGLEAILRDVLDTDVRIEQFVGCWIPVPSHEQSRLSATRAIFARLGQDAMVGSRTWDAQGTFRVVVGPVRRAQMRALMPHGAALRQMVDLVRAYVGPELGFDVRVIVAKEDVPDLRFAAGSDDDAPRLGWNSWAKSLPALVDAHDILLNPDLVFPSGQVIHSPDRSHPDGLASPFH